MQVGNAVQGLFESDKVLRWHLGWSQTPSLVPGVYISYAGYCFGNSGPIPPNLGSVKLVPTKKQPSSCTWDSRFDSDIIPPPCSNGIHTEDCSLLGKTVVAASGDICRVGSWVFYHSPIVCYPIFSDSSYCIFMANHRQRNTSPTMEKIQSTIPPWQGISSRL